MTDLFRSFDRERVEYLLIGGQAAVVYGAAQFTEDFDLWVRPDERNLSALLRALAKSEAIVDRLTPPLTLRFARKGHGFHFLLPPSANDPEAVDIMARPPRVGGFEPAKRRSSVLKTPWGDVRVVSPEDLVLLKRTNRPEDYPVISRLAILHLGASRKPTRKLVRWAAQNAFRAEDLAEIIRRHAILLKSSDGVAPRATRRLLAGHGANREFEETDLAFAEHELFLALAPLLQAGRAYWAPHRRELRKLRDSGGLWPEGAPVAGLVGRRS